MSGWLEYTYSNAFSNVVSTDFVVRSSEGTKNLILGTGYGANSNAGIYIKQNCVGIQKLPDSNFVLDVLNTFKIDKSSNTYVYRPFYASNVSASSLTVPFTSELSQITSGNIDAIGGGNLYIGSITSNIYIGNSSNTQVINIGGSNAILNIGNVGDTVNISGTVSYITTTNTAITDKTLTLNANGPAGTGSLTGIEINEDDTITGYIKTSADRKAYLFKSPGGDTEMTLDLSDSKVCIQNNLLTLSNGKIGIGVTNPTEVLHVNGNLYCSQTLTCPSVSITDTSYIHNVNMSNVYITQQNVNTSFSSNVYVTTLSPSNIKFDNTDDKRKIILFKTSDNVHQVNAIGSTSSTFTFQIESSNSDYVFNYGSNSITSTEIMRLRGKGYLGIKTANPKAELDITGSAYISNTLNTVNIRGYPNNINIDPASSSDTVYINKTYQGKIDIMNTKFNFTSNGLGIYTTSPSYPLDVQSTANFKTMQQSANNATIFIDGLKSYSQFGNSVGTMLGENIKYNSNSDNYTVYTNGTNAGYSAIVPTFDGKIRFFTNYLALQNANMTLTQDNLMSGERMTITTDGIGVGTSNPQTKLEVQNASGTSYVRVSGGAGYAQGVQFYDTALKWLIAKPANTTDLNFDTSTINVMTLKSTGYVGIGSIQPGAKLEVSATSSNSYIRVKSGTANTQGIELYDTDTRWYIHKPASTTDLRINNKTTDVVSIQTGGNIGFNITAPVTKYHFNNNASTDTIVRVSGTSTTAQGFEIYDTQSRWKMYKPANNTDFRFNNNITDVLTINTSGSLGLNVTNMQAKMHIYDSGISTNLLKCESANGYLLYDQNRLLSVFSSIGVSIWNSGSSITVSDKRMKDNITSIDSDEALEKVMRLQGVRFDFIPELGISGKQIGLIAQEVENVVPEVVQKLNDYYQVSYDKIVPLLIESIKALNKKIEQQNIVIASLIK